MPRRATEAQDVMNITPQPGEPPMFRRTILAVAATAVIAGASLTPASAHPHFGWGGFGLGLGLIGASIAAQNYYSGYDSCYQYQTVVTPRGHLRRMLVNVCD
jgi:hypothetical protein